MTKEKGGQMDDDLTADEATSQEWRQTYYVRGRQAFWDGRPAWANPGLEVTGQAWLRGYRAGYAEYCVRFGANARVMRRRLASARPADVGRTTSRLFQKGHRRGDNKGWRRAGGGLRINPPKAPPWGSL